MLPASANAGRLVLHCKVEWQLGLRTERSASSNRRSDLAVVLDWTMHLLSYVAWWMTGHMLVQCCPNNVVLIACRTERLWCTVYMWRCLMNVAMKQWLLSEYTEAGDRKAVKHDGTLWFSGVMRSLARSVSDASTRASLLIRDVTDSESDGIRHFFWNPKSDGYLKSDCDGFGFELMLCHVNFWLNSVNWVGWHLAVYQTAAKINLCIL